MSGSIKPNNKQNLYRHEYKVIEGGRETIEGTGSYVAHVVYSHQKPDGAEAAAGGRYGKNIYEEIGLISILLEAWGSNNATVKVGKKQFGMQIGLGTSGNMDTIQPAKEIFTNPNTFNLVSFNDDWEESGDIGFFMPAYITIRDYKDKDGNTDFDKAIKYVKGLEAIAMEADNPQVLAAHKMNYPTVPSDMWQSNKSNILPVAEAERRLAELNKGKLYQKNHTCIKLSWDSSSHTGVSYKIDYESRPFYEHKFRYERDDLSGAVCIYEFPQIIETTGKTPDDMYCFIGHDPYISDRLDQGNSLGASYILMNPKYISDGFNGNTVVASYIGKPFGGRKEYYSNLEKLMALYGNPTRGLWFEADRGDECKNYYVNRNKANLLALRPQRVDSKNIHAKRIVQYGFTTGGKIGKIDKLDKFADWLLDFTTLSDGKKLNIERLPCIFLVRQIAQYDLEKGNYDAVSAMIGCIVGLKEHEHQLFEDIKKKHSHNPLSFLSQNRKLFADSDLRRRERFNRKHDYNENLKVE